MSTLWHDGRIRLFAHYTTSLSSLCIRIWSYWTSKMLLSDCVSKIKSILSVIVHAIFGSVCVQLTHSSYDDFGNMCTLSYYHYWLCWGLGHKTMLCAVCFSISLLIIYLRQMMRVAFGDILLHSYQIKSSNKSIQPTDLVQEVVELKNICMASWSWPWK